MSSLAPSFFQQAVTAELPVDRQIGIGCVGAGFIMADCHLVAYRQHGLNPVAITSRTRSTAEQVAARHGIASVCDTVDQVVQHPEVRVLDVAVPPDCQADVIRRAIQLQREGKGKLRAILAQKPLGTNYPEARELVQLCEDAGIVLGVNQNMRFDQSVRACKALLGTGQLGQPVLATIDMRAIPHWMPWQERQGWVTLRIMSIHHLDTLRYWLGEPERVFASVAPDPRTARKFAHEDGIALYILEFPGNVRAGSWDDVWAGPSREGAGSDIGIRWRVEGTLGLARGTIGWPSYPERTPSTLDYSTTADQGQWHQPRWDSVWFPDAFIGPMSELLCSLEQNRVPSINGRENLKTMALVDACYLSAKEHRAVSPQEIASRSE
ncbi:MAG: Gfo/Idh/MocA family oxidoreductase [Planctomycetaceae bacterium]|nr:Gfo/Idh/MocA family oxidoreductase [Planctomycetaceae bacterium]